jgi:hypothetical protein
MSRSDPHLAAMLAIFARLAAGEAITSSEQVRFRGTRAWCSLVWPIGAARLLVTHACRAFRWIAVAVARPWPGWERSWLGLGAGHVRPGAEERSR